MRVAVGQMRVVAGNIEQNMKIMKEMIKEAKQKNADLIVFPELCVTGYFLGDQFHNDAFMEKAMKCNEEIKNLSDGIGILYGNVFFDAQNYGKDGRKAKYNAAYFFHNQNEVIREDGKKGVYLKHLLPSYDVFDDARYFLSGFDVARKKNQVHDCSAFVIKIEDKDYRIGVQVCEDLWSENYSFDPTQFYISQKVDYIVNLSASPWSLGKETNREKQIQRYIDKEDFTNFVYVNAAGMQNTGKTICLFDGGSKVYNEKGNCVGCCNEEFNQELSVFDFKDAMCKCRKVDNKLLKGLITACKEVDAQWFNQGVKWIVGLSGGLDSSITTALLVAALGSDRVIGYNMASKYNREKTKNNARQLAENLGIELREGSIEKIVDATIETTQSYGYDNANEGLTLENIQARLRGHLLSTFASLEKGVIVNNGNKIEIALGYCTLYGDSIGVFSPIGDCTKVQLFDLAHQLNDYFGKEVVPLNLLPEKNKDSIRWDMPPSAELKDEQLDPMKWFYHDWLINKLMEYPSYSVNEIITAYEDKSLFDSEIGSWLVYYGLDDPEKFYEDLNWILSMMEKSVFKRLQMPPIVMISSKAFGTDFREVQGKFLKV